MAARYLEGAMATGGGQVTVQSLCSKGNTMRSSIDNCPIILGIHLVVAV